MAEDLLIQASALQGFTDLLNRNQLSSSAIFQKVGLNDKAVFGNDARISVAKFADLLRLSAEMLNQPDFGMQLGSLQNFSALGMLGQLLQSCKTVKDAMEISQSYMSFHNQAEVWRSETYEHTARLVRFDLLRNRMADSQYAELAFATCIQLFKVLVQGDISGFKLQLSHSRTSSGSSYKQYMGIPTSFDHEQDALVFPKEILSKPLRLGDDCQFAEAYEQVVGSQNLRQASFYDRANLLIQQVISAGAPSIEFIAKLMNVHKRTLQRHLDQHDITYKALLSSVRMEKARWYLTYSKINITLLADILGYKDTANFSRAFKREHGCSPSKWKKLSNASNNPLPQTIRCHG